MDEFFQALAGFSLGLATLILATLAGLGLGLAHRFIRIWRNRRNAPTEEKKQEVLRLIQEWKALGYSYSKRHDLLRQRGYRQDVADALLGEAEKTSIRQS